MKYLKYFEQASAYESYKNGSDYILPNVSYAKDNNVVYYNSLDTNSSNNINLYPKNYYPEVAAELKQIYNTFKAKYGYDSYLIYTSNNSPYYGLVDVLNSGDEYVKDYNIVNTPEFDYILSLKMHVKGEDDALSIWNPILGSRSFGFNEVGIDLNDGYFSIFEIS